MIIESILPNPIGDDTVGEEVVLKNEGAFAIDLAGWKIENGRGAAFTIRGGTLLSGESKVFRRTETKLTLRNSNETITLRDAKGVLVDSISFAAAAKEGERITHASRAVVTPKSSISSTGQSEEIRFEELEAPPEFISSSASLYSLYSTWLFVAFFFGILTFYAHREYRSH